MSPSLARSGGAFSYAHHIGGLDGLRAIAVALVVIYHFFPSVLPGGFIGVDIFFAISGFLITTLLLRESRRRGRFRFLAFWQRRARRLLPALALMLLVCTSLALLIGGDVLVRVGAQILGAALFVSNWMLMLIGSDYFTQATPELFRNTWSLGVEEQYYLVLPVLVLGLLLVRGLFTRAMILLVLGVASAWWMVALSMTDASATRVYFGTDTHMFGLLLGASLACLLPGRGQYERPSAHPRAWNTVQGVLVVGGLGVLGVLAVTMIEGSTWSFQGGLQLATLAALVVIGAATREGSTAGRLLDISPLRWIGERSYGIYLWHWPLWVLATAAFPELPRSLWGSVALGVGGIVITLAVSAFSYTVLEMPVRKLGIRRSLSRSLQFARLRPSRRFAVSLFAAVLVVTVPASAYAVATAPSMTEAEAVIAAGLEALEAPAPSPSPQPCTPVPTTTTPTTPEPQPFPAGDQMLAVGDSVMLASAAQLQAAFPGIVIDAQDSRKVPAGIDVIRAFVESGQMRPILIIGLATNGPIIPEELRPQLDTIRQMVPDAKLVLVSGWFEGWYIPGANQALTEFAAANKGVVVADWNAAITPHPDFIVSDRIHPNAQGAEVYAATIRSAIEQLQSPEELTAEERTPEPTSQPIEHPCA